MLFEPDDIFEVRVKEPDAKGAVQTWFRVSERSKQFAEVMVPIHEQRGRHIWVGVCPRERIGSSTPSVARVLWVDLNDTVKTLDEVHKALAATTLPPPTMIVNSGNGFHLYWKLAQPIPAKDVRPWTQGVHQALPADSTHDPTRVMRVPGTLNVKDPNNPTRAFIVEYHPERIYTLDRFPKAEAAEAPKPQPGANPNRQRIPLNDQDFDTFVANWVQGQRHNLAVGVAGFLRKNLGYSKDECMAEIARIHEAAGYEMDDNLRKVVEDTYAKPFALVAGTAKLYEYGIVPSTRDNFRIVVRQKPKPPIEVIDFSRDVQEQEFWIEGLVGPGLMTIWAAEPKTGKSFAAMQMGYSLSTGEPLWDFETDGKQHRVLYFQGELTMQMVMQRARNLFGLDAVRDRKRFAITSKPREPVDLVKHPEILTDLAQDYEVVIVDPISVFHGNDENSSHSVKEVLSVFDSLRADGKAVVLIHHTNKLATGADGLPTKPSFSNIRGSNTWFAAADALALHYRVSQYATDVKFAFRAAPDREKLRLYRMPTGGFTHDFEHFRSLMSESGLRFSVDS